MTAVLDETRRNGAALIDVRGLCAGYDQAPVVRDLDLTVGPGEVVALLGPNGAGKTTTLLTISGLVKPMGGTVEVLGEPVVGDRPAAWPGAASPTFPRTAHCSSTSRSRML